MPGEPMPQPVEEPLSTTAVPPSPWSTPAVRRPQAAFTAGGVIAKTFRVWWKRFLPFTLLSVAATAPMAAWVLDLQRGVGAGNPADPFAAFRAMWTGRAVVLWLASMILHVVALGAMTHGTFEHLRGGRPRLAALVSLGTRRALPVAGTLVAAWLAIAGGMLLLVVPGAMIACAWVASVPAVVVERLGPKAAFSRSSALSRGSRWAVFGAFAALFAIVWALAAVVQGVATVVAFSAVSQAQAPLWTAAISQLGGAMFSSIPAIGAAVAYHDLRAAREGLDTDQLASVFE
jgi:hypothetical protein